MNGKNYAYLDIAALPGVAEVLLDPRPAIVFRGDGSGVLFANAAGMDFLGERSMGAALARRFATASPLARQVSRLAKALPADHARLEILRFSFGVSQVALPAACRRLNLRGGGIALLVVGAIDAPRESVATRAERLADAIAGEDGLVALLAEAGEVLGASGRFAALAPASAAIDGMIELAEEAKDPVIKRSIVMDGARRAAGIARIEAAGDRIFLLIVGPEEDGTAAADPLPATSVARHVAIASPPEVAGAAPPPAPQIAVASRGVRQFLWETDADLRFTFVSAELADIVGQANAGIVGKTWREVALEFGLDPEERAAAGFTSLKSWTGVTVYWPEGGTGESIATDLSALPIFGADRTFAGYRGFATMRLDDRRPFVPPLPETGTPGAAATVIAAPLPETDEAVDAAARKGVEGGPTPPAVEVPRPAEPEAPKRAAAVVSLGPRPSNVVRLPGPPIRVFPMERLTGTEQDAFRRIAEALGVRMADEAIGAAGQEAAPASEARAESTESETRLLDKLPVGVLIYRDHQTLFANRALLDLLGYATLADFARAGGADAVFPEADWTRSGTAGPRDAPAALARDGNRIPVEARLHAVTWGPTPALMLSLMKREDGERSVPAADVPAPAMERDPGQAEERAAELEAILDTATDGIVVIDIGGRIGSLNRSAEALFGIAAREVVGKPFTDLLAEESHRAALDYLDGLAANGVASVLNDGREVIGKVPKGGLIPLFMTMGRLAGGEKFCAVLRDITYWKNVEGELIAARRSAEAANAQKSDFLAKISHEIRTPLNAIIGFSEVMIEERFGPVGNDRYRNYLRDIHVSGAHLMSLINDLLDLSKVEAGKLELSFEAVALNAAITEAVALMQPQANRERIIIRTSLGANVPNVVADPRSLRQILLNLLSNAIKFTQAGGQVIVATTLEESGEVAMRIRDTGIGMSEKDLETAMKPFRQVAAASQGRGEGTGLGLPLTKALVEANRATFSIDSVPNQGTLVRVVFPTTRVLAG